MCSSFEVAVIQHGALTGRRGAYRLVTADLHQPVLRRPRGAGRVFPLGVPHAHAGADGLRGRVDEPVEIAGRDLRLEKLLPQGKLDAVLPGVDAGDVDLPSVDEAGDALPHRVAVDAPVPAEHPPVQHEVSRRRQLRAPGEPAGVVLVRDEADLHAVGLVCDGQAEVLRHRAHLRFLKAAEGQDEARDLRAREAAEHIALVVGGHALVKRPVLRAGVVPGRDRLRSQSVGEGEQVSELHRGIAQHAGVRRLAPEIGRRKGAADRLLQLPLHVPHGQRDAEAGRRAERVGALLLPGVVEIQPLHLVPLPLQEARAYGGVHAAGKPEYDLHARDSV